MVRPGRFITLEGVEGAGKSTQLDAIVAWAESHDLAVVATREPGGTGLGEAIRGLLMDEYDAPMPAMSELLLMFAARAAHLAQVIEPALAHGAWVVCDRFTDASFAFQGAARGLGADAVSVLEQLVQGERRPDQVLLFDLPAEKGLARVAGRGAANRFDREALAFHRAVRAAYLARADQWPARYTRIDAAAPPANIRAQVEAALAGLL